MLGRAASATVDVEPVWRRATELARQLDLAPPGGAP
jgi:hypothetical protein